MSLSYLPNAIYVYMYIYIYVSRDIAACPHLHASAWVHYSPYTPPRERTIGNASRRLSSTRRDFTIQSLFRVRLSAKGKHVPCRTRFPQADNSAYYTTKLQRQQRDSWGPFTRTYIYICISFAYIIVSLNSKWYHEKKDKRKKEEIRV